MSSYSKNHFPIGVLPAAAGDPGDQEALAVRAGAIDQEVPDSLEGTTDQEVLAGHAEAIAQEVLAGHAEAIAQEVLDVLEEVAGHQEVPAARAETVDLGDLGDLGDLADAGNQDLQVDRDLIALFGLHVKKDTGTMAICKNYDYKDSRRIPFFQRGFVVG